MGNNTHQLLKLFKPQITFANKEDTNWHNSSAGNIVSSTYVLKHKKSSAIFRLKTKNLSSPCHEKHNLVRTKISCDQNVCYSKNLLKKAGLNMSYVNTRTPTFLNITSQHLSTKAYNYQQIKHQVFCIH